MTTRPRILLVDDDTGMLRTLQVLLEDAGYEVDTASSGDLAVERLRRGGVQAVLSDVAMPGMDGIALLRAVREQRPNVPMILMTAFGSVRTAVEAMKLGAYQYLTKPVDPDELLVLLQRALAQARAEAEHRQLRERAGDPEQYDLLVGESPAMAALRETIGRVAAVDSTVLVRGETGTGKELVARLIHRGSHRAPHPFVVVNCTAIPGELIESELFGHEKGAFTGATASRAGRIEEAEGGTLMLDEIGDMPPLLQPKLLRFLQDRIYRRVGGSGDRAADLRIVAATHRDLEQATSSGAFREDLFHRLNAIPLRVPPLREHPQDLPALCAHLVAKLCRRLGRRPAGICAEALDALAGYGFPGNVRELENLLERALVLGPGAGAGGAQILPGDLPVLQAGPRQAAIAVPLEGAVARLAAIFDEAERDVFQRAVAAWPRLSNAEIAERLGTNRRVFELRLKHLGIVKP